MAKRFTDSTKWGKRWFSSLSVEHKLLWIYILDECDHCGVWSGNFRRLEFDTGVGIDAVEFERVFLDKAVAFEDGKYFIPSFIEFQQGTELSESKNAHKPILAFLRKYGFETKSPYSFMGSPTHQEPIGMGPGKGISKGIGNSSLSEVPDEKTPQPLVEDPVPEGHTLGSWIKLCSEAHDRALEKLGLPPARGMWESAIRSLVNGKGATKVYFAILGLGEQAADARYKPQQQSQVSQLWKDANLQRLVPLGQKALERISLENGGAA